MAHVTVAQSPVHSRGMMIGIWYASWEVGFILNFCITFLFDCHSQDIVLSSNKRHLSFLSSCGQCLWYCMAKCYKYRVKENEVNIHQILLTEKAHKHALYNVLLGEVLHGWQHLLIKLELFG